MSFPIIFFIAGMNPTEEERAQAKELGTDVFRNTSEYNDDSSTEKCDAVAGCVPKVYEGFPLAGDPAMVDDEDDDEDGDGPANEQKGPFTPSVGMTGTNGGGWSAN